jgi:unsaturated rhamnogalacturonyl hydrolase
MKIQAKILALSIAAGIPICVCQPLAGAQHELTPKEQQNIATNEVRHFGDAPDNPGPLATDLSYSIKPKAVAKAMRKVADWQLERSQQYFDRIWTWSVLYSGFMAASDSLGDPKYRDAMTAMGQKFDWKLRSHLPNADDQSVGQTYLELYLLKKDSAIIAPTQQELDAILAAPRGSTIPGKEIDWWWCDALFMAPPVWSRMYAATGDRKYIDYLDEEWAKTSDRLYDTKEHLYFRDSTYLTRTEANGKKMFWSRGNGWVMGGIVRTLQYLPKDDPARAKYIEQLKEMAASVAAIQSPDVVARDGIEPPTPAFSGPRSTTELSGLSRDKKLHESARIPVLPRGRCRVRWGFHLPCAQNNQTQYTNRNLRGQTPARRTTLKGNYAKPDWIFLPYRGSWSCAGRVRAEAQQPGHVYQGRGANRADLRSQSAPGTGGAARIPRDFPKGADLHVHLSGAVYAETLIRDAARTALCVDPVALRSPSRPAPAN